MKISHLPHLNRCIKASILQDRPMIINFQESMADPIYKITIEKIEPDTFIDKNGQLWRKVPKQGETDGTMD